MIIRKAEKSDSKAIAKLLLLAMENIFYSFIGEKSFDKAHKTLMELIEMPENQYSYENTWVIQLNNEVIAASNVYDGAELEKLRTPVKKLIEAKFNHNFNPEDETQAGEIYIDCIGVSQAHQGKGLGSKMLSFLIDKYVHQEGQTLGLLVDQGNPNAKRLYLKMGFSEVGTKVLEGKHLCHLQIKSTQ